MQKTSAHEIGAIGGWAGQVVVAFELRDRDKASLTVEAKTWEKTNDQVDRSCCLCLSRRNVGAGCVARAASSAGRRDHVGRIRMRSG